MAATRAGRVGRWAAPILAGLLWAWGCAPANGVERAGPSGGRSRLPVYLCHRIDRDIVVSGRADDPLWRRAEVARLGSPIDGRPGRYTTTARLLYNARWLYIAFDCQDEYVWGTYTARDAEVYSEECVEVFIAPSGRTRQYYELDVSPRNTVFDALILNARPMVGHAAFIQKWFDYTCEGLVTKVSVQGELGVRGARGWSVEYAIPFTAVPGADTVVPRPGDQWRLNLYRIDAPEPGHAEYYAWSPLGVEDFHVPWRFGTLRFR